MKLNFAEKIARAYASGSVPDIKGKTRITLTDVKTGAREIIEDENMVTNAVAKIFKSNMLGLTDYYNMLPAWRLFGGIMCFSAALPEDANGIYPPNNTTAVMTANAGQTAHSTASTTRGNPDGYLTKIEQDHITLAWQWGMSQGNGTIACCCLTHAEAGDCGLLPDGTLPLMKSTGQNIKDLNCYRSSVIGDLVYNRARAISEPIAIDDDGNGIALYFTGTALEEITFAHSYVTANILESNYTMPLDSENYRELATRTATLSRTFTSGYTMLAQDDSNYYVMERDSGSATTLYVDVIDKTDMSVTAHTLSGLGVSLARPSLQIPQLYNGIVSGGSVYWVSSSDAKTFCRINISNPADVEELTSSLTANISQEQTPLVMNSGLVLGRNYLINSSNVYPVVPRTRRPGTDNESLCYDILAEYKRGPHILQTGHGYGNTYDYDCQAGVLALPYLATINNITPVTKNNQKAMQIEYVLTEV